MPIEERENHSKDRLRAVSANVSERVFRIISPVVNSAREMFRCNTRSCLDLLLTVRAREKDKHNECGKGYNDNDVVHKGECLYVAF